MKKLIALILVAVCLLAGCTLQGENALLENGPWGSQAIWTDGYDHVYLVCTKGNGDTYATVTAYLAVLSDWQPLKMELGQDGSTVHFNADGKTLMQAKVEMQGDKLHMYKFHIVNNEFTDMAVNLTLTKYAYDEMIDKLPF